MDDPREFPYVVETCANYTGAKVTPRQLRTRQDAVNAITSALGSGMEVWVHKIQQVSVRDFMNEADQKNWCHNCQEFLTDSEHARRCEDLDHHLLWKDPRGDDTV